MALLEPLTFTVVIKVVHCRNKGLILKLNKLYGFYEVFITKDFNWKPFSINLRGLKPVAPEPHAALFPQSPVISCSQKN